MHTTHPSTSEVAIFSRILEPDQATLPAAAARALLALSFSPDDQTRMRQLSAKAQEGTLTAAEQKWVTPLIKIWNVQNQSNYGSYYTDGLPC
jgi:hypothetical protein